VVFADEAEELRTGNAALKRESAALRQQLALYKAVARAVIPPTKPQGQGGGESGEAEARRGGG
jgi:hypothetical protein